MSHILPKLATEYERPEQVTENDWYRLLSAERRRELLDLLDDRNDSIELDSLATKIAERSDELDAADAAAVERVTASLHHVHLPKLSDAGALRYDRQSRRITP
jgi:hypothetical protein